MSNGIEFDMSQVIAGFAAIANNVMHAAKQGVHDSMDDLKRISVEIAPIDTSTLRKSGKTRVTDTGSKIEGVITFHAVEMTAAGRINYGLMMHEGTYNLGPLSAQAPGTDGYTVGNKFLERPLFGESKKYKRWIDKEVKDALR